jgi:hypothetical protein
LVTFWHTSNEQLKKNLNKRSISFSWIKVSYFPSIILSKLVKICKKTWKSQLVTFRHTLYFVLFSWLLQENMEVTIIPLNLAMHWLFIDGFLYLNTFLNKTWPMCKNTRRHSKTRIQTGPFQLGSEYTKFKYQTFSEYSSTRYSNINFQKMPPYQDSANLEIFHHSSSELVATLFHLISTVFPRNSYTFLHSIPRCEYFFYTQLANEWFAAPHLVRLHSFNSWQTVNVSSLNWEYNVNEKIQTEECSPKYNRCIWPFEVMQNARNELWIVKRDSHTYA